MWTLLSALGGRLNWNAVKESCLLSSVLVCRACPHALPWCSMGRSNHEGLNMNCQSDFSFTTFKTQQWFRWSDEASPNHARDQEEVVCSVFPPTPRLSDSHQHAEVEISLYMIKLNDARSNWCDFFSSFTTSCTLALPSHSVLWVIYLCLVKHLWRAVWNSPKRRLINGNK